MSNRRGSGKTARSPAAAFPTPSSADSAPYSGAAARLADYTGAESQPLTAVGPDPADFPAALDGTMPDVADVSSGIHRLSTSSSPAPGGDAGRPSSNSSSSSPQATSAKEPLKVSLSCIHEAYIQISSSDWTIIS